VTAQKGFFAASLENDAGWCASVSSLHRTASALAIRGFGPVAEISVASRGAVWCGRRSGVLLGHVFSLDFLLARG
jgi:hypothetical protein